ncbi:MAG: methyltransferase domain-containing protein [Aquisalinus sp.]|nr:methyltransferase domain-containing protein [Aquisalinus sp.]
MADPVPYNSRRVESNQSGPHERLPELVRKHMTSVFQAPLLSHNVEAFEQAKALVDRHAGPLILDSGCGTGDSSRKLADQFPDHFVIGVDKSADRLGREREGRSARNLHLIRADLVDFYRLAANAGWRLARHYILYPNPWPKSAHLQRRWHGSPIFPDMLKLGGKMELRTNWQIYAQEFHEALQIAGVTAQQELYAANGSYLTLFEKKYAESGQALWRITSDGMA